MTLKLPHGAILAGLCILLAAAAPLQAGERTNVLVIIADDLNGYGFFDGYPGTQVPAMDRLKESAVTFARAYAASPAGDAARAAFFSGLYPHTTGAYRNGSEPWRKTLAGIESLPELFRRSGYTTFGAGKLFDDGPLEGREAAAWDNEVAPGGFGPFPRDEDRFHGPFWGVTEWNGPDEDFPDTVNADRVIEFLQRAHDKPFFAVFGLRRPHTPFTAPKRFFDLYDTESIAPPPGYRLGDLYDVPPGGRRLSDVMGQRWLSSGKSQPENWRRILHGYLASTSFADWNLGRVLDALDSSANAGNTIVVFLSDNGYHLGEKNHFGSATLWEVATQTPAAIRVPGNPNNGRTAMQPVVAVDIFSTLADYCELEAPGHDPQGLSLRPLLENPDATWKRPAVTTYGENVFSARNGRYRYIRYPDGEEELYDHDRDPHEFINLADKPDYKYVADQFRQWIPESFAPDLGGRNG